MELFDLLDDNDGGNERALPLVKKQIAMTTVDSVDGRERMPDDDDADADADADDLLCSPVHRLRQERELLLLPPLVQNNPISLIDLSGTIAIDIIMFPVSI